MLQRQTRVGRVVSKSRTASRTVRSLRASAAARAWAASRCRPNGRTASGARRRVAACRPRPPRLQQGDHHIDGVHARGQLLGGPEFTLTARRDQVHWLHGRGDPHDLARQVDVRARAVHQVGYADEEAKQRIVSEALQAIGGRTDPDPMQSSYLARRSWCPAVATLPRTVPEPSPPRPHGTRPHLWAGWRLRDPWMRAWLRRAINGPRRRTAWSPLASLGSDPALPASPRHSPAMASGQSWRYSHQWQDQRSGRGSKRPSRASVTISTRSCSKRTRSATVRVVLTSTPSSAK